MKILSSQQGAEKLQVVLDQEIKEQNIAPAEALRVKSSATKLAYNFDQNTEEINLEFENKFSKEKVREIVSVAKNIYLEANPEEFNNMCQQLSNNFSFNRNFLKNSPYKQKLGLLTMMHYEKLQKQKLITSGSALQEEQKRENNFQNYISGEMLAKGAIALTQAPEIISREDIFDPNFSKKLALAGVLILMKKPTAGPPPVMQELPTGSTAGKLVLPDQNMRVSLPQNRRGESAEKYKAGQGEGEKVGQEMDKYRLALAEQYMAAQQTQQKHQLKARKRRKMLIKVAAGSAFGGLGALIGLGATDLAQKASEAPESVDPSGTAVVFIDLLHNFSDIITSFC